ncbi:MAG TPA: hypothetical protein VL523_05580 [Terriglobia bacterium]|nr:hypothetical protein [Terriglobia bacterium]
MKSLWIALKKFWRGFSAFAKRLGNFQARVLLTIIYAILVLPFGVMVRLFADPLRIKKLPTTWIDHSQEKMDMSWAKRQ